MATAGSCAGTEQTGGLFERSCPLTPSKALSRSMELLEPALAISPAQSQEAPCQIPKLDTGEGIQCGRPPSVPTLSWACPSPILPSLCSGAPPLYLPATLPALLITYFLSVSGCGYYCGIARAAQASLQPLFTCRVTQMCFTTHL